MDCESVLSLGGLKIACQLGEHVELHAAEGEKMQADGQGAIEKVFYKVTWGTTRFGDDTEEIFIKMVDTWAA